MDKRKKESLPVVSIIITTKNEQLNIGNCLKSIKEQDYPEDKIEVIVVDNNSSDKTKQTALEFTNKVFNFGPERSAQRNFGGGKSSGEYLIYLDADMILSPTVIRKSVEKSEEKGIIALYIPEIVLGNSYWSKVRRFERSFYDGTVIDCVRFVRKSIFDEVGGFDLSMTGPEDWDFDKKVRGKGKAEILDTYDLKEINNKLSKDIYSETSDLAVIYHNEAEFNLKKYFEKKSYYARSFSIYINKWGKSDHDLRKQFGFWYRYFWVFFENGKWRKLISYPGLVLGMFFLRFLVGISLVISWFR